MLQNTAWGVKSAGTVKPMFSAATTFHSSLFSSGIHVINFSDVSSYTLAATGQDTIARVSFDSNYAITALTYSNAGDETVLQKSAGYGTPNYLYMGTTHTGMVSSSTVISRIKTIISAETGISALSASSSTIVVGVAEEMYEIDMTVEIDPNTLPFNDRGWIDSLDNLRINIYADIESSLMINGEEAIEENNVVYGSDGSKIGSVWELGETGTKLYALYDGEYEVVETEFARIEYMDGGYFDKVLEYDVSDASVSHISEATLHISIESYKTQGVDCIINDATSRAAITLEPSYILTAEELNKLNAD